MLALVAALAMVASLLPAGIASPIAAHASNGNGTPNFDHCPGKGGTGGSTDLFVSADASNDDADGTTEDNPFATIGDAVEKAADGDTICVAAGTYKEAVTIGVKGLTLAGPDAGDGAAVVDADEADRAIDVKKDDVTMEGLTVQKFKVVGIIAGDRHERVNNVTISNNVVTEPATGGERTLAGIEVQGGNPAVKNNEVDMMGDFGEDWNNSGIIADSVTGADIVGNEFREVEDTGIAISTFRHGPATGTTITNNTMHDVGIGIDLFAASKGHISDIQIEGNEIAGANTGLRLWPAHASITDITISGNNFEQTSQGVDLRENSNKISDTSITDNTFENNGEGIGLRDNLERATITGNTFTVNDFAQAQDLDPKGKGTFVRDYADVATDTNPTLEDIRQTNTFTPRPAVVSSAETGTALIAGDLPPSPAPTPPPEPEAPAPPERTPAPDPEEQVEVEEPEVPEGTTVERERGTAGAIVDGVEVETSVSTPEVAPSDPDVPPSEEEVEQRRTVTRQFVDEVLADVLENQRGVSVVDTDDGAAIVGLLADRDDATQSRPVPPTAVAAVSAGDVRLLAAVTDRRGNPRDRAEDGTLRGAPGGDAAVRMFGLPSDTDGQVQVRSTARVLGVVTTDDAGRLASQVEVPSDLPPGDHTLVVTVGGNTTSIGITVEADFDDVAADSTHVDAIEALAEDGVFQGRTDGTFGPQQGLVRGQMATVLARLLELDIDPDADIPFDDVAANSTHAGAIAAIEGQGFTEGCDNNGRFCPDTVVTRGQLAAFLARAYDLPASDDDPFTDIATATLADEIRAAAAAGVVQGFGDDTFRPNETVTRAQAATMLFNAREVAEE